MSTARSLAFPKFNYYKPKKHHADWRNLNKEALELAIRIAKNITLQQNFLQRTMFQKRKILAIFRTIKYLLENKRKMTRQDHNFVPLFYIYTMTNACNFFCSYCSNHRGGVYPELFRQGKNKDLSTEQAKQLIKIMKDTTAIYYCGGEPTIRKDLPELLEYSTKLNMFNIINTNGSLIGDLLLKPDYKNFLLNMDVIIISLDSLSIPQLAEMYSVNENVARKVLRNILTLRILQNFVPFKLVANTVITKETIEESFDILDWCNDLKITFSPVSANIDEHADLTLINNPRYRELVEKILERAREGHPMISSPRMLERLLYAKNINCFPTVFDHVDYNGKVFWPCKAYKNAAMILVLKYKNVKEVHDAGTRHINPTNFHRQGENQCKGNCSWMQNVVTHVYGEALKLGFFDSGIFKEIRYLLVS
ncbi:MAG: radical SAM protein [Candidatus Helarchaeota archaeon]